MTTRSTTKGMKVLAVVLGVMLVTSHGAAQEPANVTATTIGNTSSTSTPNPDCRITFRLYDPVELSLLSLDSGGRSCRAEVPGLVVRHFSGYVELTNFPEGFRGPADLVSCIDEIHHSDCEPFLDDYRVRLLAYGGPQGELPTPPAICPARIECNHYNCTPEEDRVADQCGDVDGNGAVRAVDALAILRASVDLQACPAVRCDADRDATIAATDAQLVLRAGIGIDALLLCPAPCEPWSPG